MYGLGYAYHARHGVVKDHVPSALEVKDATITAFNQLYECDQYEVGVRELFQYYHENGEILKTIINKAKTELAGEITPSV